MQFIQFGCSLVSKGQEIYDAEGGLLLEHVECESATNRLMELANRLRPSIREVVTAKPNPGAGDPSAAQAIEDICDNCLAMSKELVALLDKFRIKEGGRHRKWRSFRHALKSVWSKGDLESIETRLRACQNELDSHLIANIRYIPYTI